MRCTYGALSGFPADYGRDAETASVSAKHVTTYCRMQSEDESIWQPECRCTEVVARDPHAHAHDSLPVNIYVVSLSVHTPRISGMVYNEPESFARSMVFKVARRKVLFERTSGTFFVWHEGKTTHAARHV